MKSLLFTVLLLIAVSTTHSSFAQVTIGSGESPNTGALLDLKQKADGTSTKGLVLPRVSLNSKTDLFPMFTDDYSGGYVEGTKATEDMDHIGLVVYNKNACNGFAKGLYVWVGTEWTQITDNTGLLTPELKINGQENNLTIDIISGIDNRGTTILPITFNAAWISDNGGASTTTTGLYQNYTTIFSPMPAWVNGNTINLTTSPDSYTLQPNSMSNISNIGTDPWQARGWELNYNVVGNECNDNQNISRKVNLIQRNYAILSYNDSYSTSGVDINTANIYLKLNNTTGQTLRIKSNVAWKTSISGNTGIMTHNVPTNGGENLSAGVAPPNEDFTLTAINGTGTKHQIARIKIEDRNTTKLAKDVTVRVYSCVGTDASYSGLTTATPAQTSGANIWGTSVVRHQAKTGYYEEFLSADFGPAGRWMTTNLAAYKYDDNSGFGGQSVPWHNGVYEKPTTLKMAYPNTSSWSSKPYNWNSEYGLMYNWAAAARGNTSTANQRQIAGATPGADEVEMTGPKGTAPNKYVQGICPDGWHLPSDREWNTLEKEIYNNTLKYSNYIQQERDLFTPASWNPTWESSGTYAGSTAGPEYGHGAAMKNGCNDMQVNYFTKGYSKSPAAGGFSALFCGRIYAAQRLYYAQEGFYWTSSFQFAPNEDAYLRHFNRISSMVLRPTGYGVDNLISVRCKKN